MAEYIRLPNGAYFELKPGEDAMTGFYAASKLHPDAFGQKTETPKTPEEKGFFPALKGAYQGMKGEAALTAGKLGVMDEEAAQKYYEEQKAKGYKPTEEGWTESPFLKLRELAGSAAAYMALPAAAGAAAATAPVSGAAALGLGALASVPSFLQFTGSNLGRQVETGKTLKEADLGAAALAAIPQTALDTVSMRMIPGLSRLLGVSETVAKNIAEQSLKRAAVDYTLHTGKAIGVEGLTESAQQVFERAQAGLSITDPEARKEYFDNFIGGGVLGGVIGLPGRKFQRMGMQARYDKQQQAIADAKLEAEEAEKNKPENLLKLFDEYTATKDKAAQLTQAINAGKPSKKKKDAYAKWEEESAGLREEASDNMARLEELRNEYRQREDLIKPLVAQRQAAQPAPAAAPPAPPPPAPPTVQELMDQYDALSNQYDELAAKLTQTRDPKDSIALDDQLETLDKQLKETAKAVNTAGGTTETANELDKKIARAQEALAKSAEIGDRQAQRKAAEQLIKLQEKRAVVEGRAPRTAVEEQPQVAAPAEQAAPTVEAPAVEAPAPVTEMPAAEQLEPPAAPAPLNIPTPYEMFGAQSLVDPNAPRLTPQQFAQDFQLPSELFGEGAQPVPEVSLLEKATKLVRDTNKVTVSHIAEGLGVNNRLAAQLIKELETEGVVSPAKGNKRTVIPTTPAVAETPVAETPVAETPVAETPAAETPAQPQDESKVTPPRAGTSSEEIENAIKQIDALQAETIVGEDNSQKVQALIKELEAAKIIDKARADEELALIGTEEVPLNSLKDNLVRSVGLMQSVAASEKRTKRNKNKTAAPLGSLAQEAQSSLFRERGEKPAVGMRVADVDSQIAPFRQLPVAPNIQTVQSVSELLPEIQAQMERDGTRGAPGLFYPPTKTIYMIGDNLVDAEDAGKTIAHELVGHFGLRGVLGQQYPAVMRAIYQNSKPIQAEAKARMQENPNMSLEVATEESIAERAEKDVSLNWMHRLTNFIRTKLRQWGIWKGAPIGDSEIIRLIRDSHKYVHGVSTKPSETVRALAKIAPSGKQTAKAGEALYRSRKPTKSVVAKKASAVDDLIELYTGLTGGSTRAATIAGLKNKNEVAALHRRMRMLDQYAPLIEALTKGVDAKKIDAFRVQNIMYFLRFGQQRSDFVQQVVTEGPVKLTSEKTKAGTEFTYEADKNGPNMIKMAKSLEKAKGYKEDERENAFTMYLAGQRAAQVGWNKLRFDNPVEAENEYKAVLAHLKQNPADDAAFKEAAKIYKDYNAGLLDFLVQTGTMSKQKADELKQSTYVPFYRVDKDGNIRMETGDERRPIRIGNIKSEPRLKELLGDSEQILPIFTSALQNTSMLMHMALRNQTIKDTVFALKDLGIVSRIVPKKGPYTDNVVHFRVHGVEHHAIIDTDMYGIPAQMIVEGLEGIKVAMPAIVRMMGLPGDIFRKFTVRNPLYPFRQLVRDPVAAWVQNGTSTIPILDSFSTLAKMATGKDTTAQRLRRAGATSSNVLVGDARDMTKFLEDLTAGKWSLGRAFSKLDALSQQADAATRQVIYEDSIKKGMSHQQALMRTLESMNFSRRGTSPSMYLLSSLTPFMHSQVQGLDVTYRSMRGQLSGTDKLKTAQKFAARATMLAMSSLAYAAMMQDDEDYKRAKPEDRYGYWWFPTLGLTKENWLKIPIPYEIGFLFKALPEAIINTAFGDEKARPALEAIGRLLSQSQPLSLPQAIKPITEVMLGSSFYSGPIESPHEKEILPEKRYRTNTTEVAKMLGGVAGLSPIEIDYLIRGYTGGVGMAITQMANVFLRAPEAADIAKPTTKLSEVPLFGALFQTSEGRGALDATYKLIEEIQQYKGAYNKLVEDQRFEDAAKFANENASILAASSAAGYMKKTLGEMSKQARMIKAAPNMTTEQKDAALEKLYVAQLALSRNFLKVAERTTLR